MWDYADFFDVLVSFIKWIFNEMQQFRFSFVVTIFIHLQKPNNLTSVLCVNYWPTRAICHRHIISFHIGRTTEGSWLDATITKQISFITLINCGNKKDVKRCKKEHSHAWRDKGENTEAVKLNIAEFPNWLSSLNFLLPPPFIVSVQKGCRDWSSTTDVLKNKAKLISWLQSQWACGPPKPVF